MRRYFIMVFLLLLAAGAFAQGSKVDRKNKKAVGKEENQFEKNRNKNPNSATPYLEHANNLAAIPSESARAGGFYELALKYDSANAEVYKDYGIYLSDKLRSCQTAKPILEKALSFAPGDNELKKHLESVNAMLAAQEAENKLRYFGNTNIRENNPAGNIAVLTKFDSLKLCTLAPDNKYYYPALMKRFLADDKTITPDEMYMLIIGFTAQPTYNAFSYNDINEMKMMAGSSIDTAIRFGLDLVKVNPLNPTLNRELMYYYRKKDQAEVADKYLARVQQFFNGVLWSGNGTCERPYISLWSKEEYNFLTYIGYKATESHYMGQCAGHMAEIIDAVNNATQKTEPVSFNVGLIYMQTVGK